MARILFVDDDISVCHVISDFLAIDKHDVELANDGNQGYNRLSTNEFHLAVLDWDMPGMTGPEICRKYRAGGGQTPILILTGRSDEDAKELGLDAGADDYLTKPFSLKELGARIRSLLRRSNPLLSSTGAPVNRPEALDAVRVCTSCGKQFDAWDPAGEICSFDKSSTVLIAAKQLIGKVIANKYQLMSLLGVGAWSEIYLAIDSETRDKVAVKILHTHLAADPLKSARFRREADALLRLKHPGLAKVFAQSEIGFGRPCLIMEYLDGMSFDKALSTKGRLNLDQARQVFLPLCDALTHAHEQGLIHRDLKPSNVFICVNNTNIVPKILDFGLAKISGSDSAAMASLTQSGEVIGTPAYMSPEQCRGEPIDARSDLYALGCLLYEALTGVRAIPGKSAFEAMSNQLSRYPDPINDACPDAQVSQDVEDIIFKLLAKDPDDRFISARAFAEEFEKSR